MNKLAIEACLRCAVANLDQAWTLIRADAHEWRRRVETLSDSLAVPRLAPNSSRSPTPSTLRGMPRNAPSDGSSEPKATQFNRVPETLVTCMCCGEGLVASSEMELWTRKTEHPKVR